jgi:hypothetical protein
VVHPLGRLDDPPQERDGLGEPLELEPLVDLAALVLPAGKVGQAASDLFVR